MSYSTTLPTRMAFLAACTTAFNGNCRTAPADTLSKDILDASSGRLPFTLGSSLGIVYPLIQGAAGTVAHFSVYVVKEVGNPSPTEPQQRTFILAGHFSCVAGASTGIANGVVSDSWRYCDTITVPTDAGLPPAGSRVFGQGGAGSRAGVAFDGLAGRDILIVATRNTAADGSGAASSASVGFLCDALNAG